MPESEDWPDGRPVGPQREPDRDRRTGSPAAAARIQHQHSWVDLQIRQAQERGEFDNLPGAGKPIEGLGAEHDPNWWLKNLVERERIAVLPPSLALRKEDSELDDRLDRLAVERDVRREIDDFNERVIRARYQLPEGPPLITMPRDVEATVAAWHERRAVVRTPTAEPAVAPKRRHWWSRRPRSDGGR